MNFRYHKGSLAESLATTIKFKDKKELYQILQTELSQYNFFFKEDDLKCSFYGYDIRCKQNTFLITIKNYGVIGMTDYQI